MPNNKIVEPNLETNHEVHKRSDQRLVTKEAEARNIRKLRKRQMSGADLRMDDWENDENWEHFYD